MPKIGVLPGVNIFQKIRNCSATRFKNEKLFRRTKQNFNFIDTFDLILPVSKAWLVNMNDYNYNIQLELTEL